MSAHALRLLTLLVSTTLLVPVGSTAQTFRGKVVDQADNRPLHSAAVLLIDTAGKETSKTPALTDTLGAFRISAPDAGRYRLRVSLIGYNGGLSDTVTVRDHEMIEVELQLSTQPIAMAPLVVKAHRKLPDHLDMVGFNERRKAGFGYFVGRNLIKNIKAGSLLDVLRLVPGVIVSPGGFGGRGEVTMARSSALRCRPTVYMDGTPVQSGGSGNQRFGMPDPRIEDLIDPEDLAAVEVYRGESEAPIQFGGKQARCGVILLWSRIEDDEPDAK
jgi:hypothetical protein